LHFGLFSFGGSGRTFGGVGVALEEPGLRLRFDPADRLECVGAHSERIPAFVQRWLQFQQQSQNPQCKIEVLSAPPEHVGLGLGTQLGLSVAFGLNEAYRLPEHSPVDLAFSVGRGERSSVGAYAFCLGGFIVERGKLPGETLSPLECQMPIPPGWRFVLIRPQGIGLSGDKERKAFKSLPPVTSSTRENLIDEVRHRMAPALAAEDFVAFSESVTQFGRTAGMCYAEQQGGPYNGPVLNHLVDLLQQLGVRGVGQSSWGPTLFALAPNDQAAQEIVSQIQEAAKQPLDCSISAPRNRGAEVANQVV